MSTDGSSVRENAAPVEQAKAILALNWTGEYTQPGPRHYPHQRHLRPVRLPRRPLI